MLARPEHAEASDFLRAEELYKKASSNERRRLKDRAFKELQLHQDHPFAAPYINEPSDGQKANCIMLSPHAWIDGLRTGEYRFGPDIRVPAGMLTEFHTHLAYL